MRNPHPLSSSQLVAGIETLINAGQYDAAIRRLKLLLHDHTDDARLHHIAGVAQLRAGRAAKAITYFRKAVRLQPGRGEYLFHLGEAARVGGQYRLALDAYDKAIKAGESVYAVKIRLGDTCERMGRLDQALDHFEQALATLPSDTALAVRIANLLNRLDRRDEAIALLSRIVRCNPNGAAYNNLGIMLRDVGEITEALDALAKACELAPDAAEYLCNLARVQQDALLYDDAAASLHRAVDLAPTEPRALIALATLEERRNNLTIALRDPRDVVLSCWMQNFRLNEAMVQFLDIERTAAAYAAVMSFWRDHRDLLDGRYIEYRYEDLVDDFDTTLKRLVAFVGLPRDDGVLGFGKTAAGHVISTPSARDVSGGQIYRRARGRWHRYRVLLEPVLPVLAPCLEAFGYDD